MNTVTEFVKSHTEWKNSEPGFSSEAAYNWEPGDTPAGHYDWRQSEPKGPLILLPDGDLQAFVKPDEYLHLKDVHSFHELYMSREDALKLADWIRQIYG